jgi:hypothetical protein
MQPHPQRLVFGITTIVASIVNGMVYVGLGEVLEYCQVIHENEEQNFTELARKIDVIREDIRQVKV